VCTLMYLYIIVLQNRHLIHINHREASVTVTLKPGFDRR
jgi:hypothetical protein